MQENSFKKMTEGNEIFSILKDTSGFGLSRGGDDSIDIFIMLRLDCLV